MTETYREHLIWVWTLGGWKYHEHTNTLAGLWETVKYCREQGRAVMVTCSSETPNNLAPPAL